MSTFSHPTPTTAGAPPPRHRRFSGCSRRRVPRGLVVILGLVAATAPLLEAAQSPRKSDSPDAAPVLMARTGGGNMWTNVKELEQAAAKGNPKAEAQLGEMLLRGEGIAKDEARAVGLLEKAARQGNSAAAFRVGMLLMNGQSGVARDPERALAYFRAAAAGGEKEAFFNIGAAYGSARGVKRDYGEALGWLIVARQRGADPNAEKELRARISGQPAWIARGERRAKEIEQEFAGRTVVELLPPVAPLDAPAEPPLAPTGTTSPASLAPDLKPARPAAVPPGELLRPALPALPPPSIKP